MRRNKNCKFTVGNGGRANIDDFLILLKFVCEDACDILGPIAKEVWLPLFPLFVGLAGCE